MSHAISVLIVSVFLPALFILFGLILVIAVLQERWREHRFTDAVVRLLEEYFPFLNVKVEARGGFRSDPHVIAEARDASHAIQLLEVEERQIKVGKSSIRELRCRMLIKSTANRPEFSVIIEPESIISAIIGGEDILVDDPHVDARLRFKGTKPDQFKQYFAGNDLKFLREVSRITCFKEIKITVTPQDLVFHFIGKRVGQSHVKEFLALALLLAWHDSSLARATEMVESFEEPAVVLSREEIQEQPPTVLGQEEKMELDPEQSELLSLVKKQYLSVSTNDDGSVMVQPPVGLFSEIKFRMVQGLEKVAVTARGTMNFAEEMKIRFTNDCLEEAEGISSGRGASITSSERCIRIEGTPSDLVELIKNEITLLDAVSVLNFPKTDNTIELTSLKDETSVSVKFMVTIRDDSDTVYRVKRFLDELSWFLELKLSW